MEKPADLYIAEVLNIGMGSKARKGTVPMFKHAVDAHGGEVSKVKFRIKFNISLLWPGKYMKELQFLEDHFLG